MAAAAAAQGSLLAHELQSVLLLLGSASLLGSSDLQYLDCYSLFFCHSTPLRQCIQLMLLLLPLALLPPALGHG
jgi:hypothetical protein